MTRTTSPARPGRALRGLAAGAGAALALTLAACGAGQGSWSRMESPPSTGAGTGTPSGSPSDAPGTDEDALARSETREDSVYPQIGDPLVDALHYELDLTWDPERDRLTGRQTLTFRATDDADTLPLDFNEQLEISALSVDGKPVEHTVDETQLRIEQPLVADREYELVLAYAGTPEPTEAPSTRADFTQGLGWSITDDHETWTLQEPYGAFTWYAVNDQPADKALYDFSLTVPSPWSGVANGQLTDTTEKDGATTTTWHLAEPASSYLVTVAFGDFQHTDLTSKSGVPLQVWTDADGPDLPGQTAYLPEAVDWVEEILGPYPFDSLGILVVDNESGMETQTMITLGDTSYSLSGGTIVHEVVHQWYGDQVTPADWSDVWMNEGMAMYLQGMWEAEQEGITIEEKMDQWADFEVQLRAGAGPPGAFDPEQFGDGNIYYGPALMWQELREKVGDETFFDVVRGWPAAQDNGNADREEYWSWIEKETGEELTSFFEDWLLGEETPSRD